MNTRPCGSATLDQYKQWKKVIKPFENVIWVKERANDVKVLEVKPRCKSIGTN